MQMYSDKLTVKHTHSCTTHTIPSPPPANPHSQCFPLPCSSSGIREIAWNERNMFFDGPFSCIWWQKTQLEVLFGAKEKGSAVGNPNTVNDGALCPVFSLFQDPSFLVVLITIQFIHYLCSVDFSGNVMR